MPCLVRLLMVSSPPFDYHKDERKCHGRPTRQGNLRPRSTSGFRRKIRRLHAYEGATKAQGKGAKEKGIRGIKNTQGAFIISRHTSDWHSSLASSGARLPFSSRGASLPPPYRLAVCRCCLRHFSLWALVVNRDFFGP